MPVFPIPPPEPGVEPPSSQDHLFIHSALNGPLEGVAFEIEGKHLRLNQPTLLAGAVTSASGSAYRPAPGQRPIGHQYSLRHPGAMAGIFRDPVKEMSVWLLRNRGEDQPVLALFNHQLHTPGFAVPHDYPNEIMLIGGADVSAAARLFRNHAPLFRRNPDYTIDFASLLDPSARATWAEFQATPDTPRIVVVASDGNFATAIDGDEEAPEVATRQMGLNQPVLDIQQVNPIDVDLDPPIGPQLKLRFVSGPAGSSGPGSFTDDPDAAWVLESGSIVEIEMDYPLGVISKDVSRDSRLFVAAFADDGGIYTTPSFDFLGTGVDQETRESDYSSVPGDDNVAVAGKATAADAAGVSVSTVYFVQWTGGALSAKSYRRDPENPDSFEFPRFVFGNTGNAKITKVVAFRAGRKLNRDDAPSFWHHAYQWERRRGAYRVRGGHSGDYEQLNTEAPANTNLRAKSFSPPLQSEEPTHMNLALRAFNVPLIQEASESEGIADAFTIVRTVPIRRTSIDPNIWFTATKYPAHDIEISRMVLDNWLDSEEIAASLAKIPGGLYVPGGGWGVGVFGGSLLFWGFPQRGIESAIFTGGSKFVESTTDRFFGWFAGRQLFYKGKPRAIRRVIRENLELSGSFTAKLELIDPVEDLAEGATETAAAYLGADLNTLYQTIDDGIHGENISIWFRWKIPHGGEEIMAVRQEGPGQAVVFGTSRTYLLSQSANRFDIYRELPTPPTTRFELLSEDNAAAGPQGVELVEGRLAADNGRGLSLGLSASAMSDVTSAKNARLFTELFASSKAAKRNLSFDNRKRHLVLSNVETLSPTYGRDREWGALWDFQNNFELSLLYPWHGYANGIARLAPGTGGAAQIQSGARRTRFAYGPVAIWADVSAVGTGGAASAAGPHFIVYDTRADTWSGFLLPEATQVEPIESVREFPVPGTHSTIQTADGKLVAVYQHNETPFFHGQAMFRAERSAAGIWSLEPGEFLGRTGTAGNSAEVFALAPARDGSFYALRFSEVAGNAVAVYHYDAGTVMTPFNPGEGGRVRTLALGVDAAFSFLSFSSNGGMKTVMALAAGPAGELYAVGYVFTAGPDVGTVTIRRLDPRSMLPHARDFSFTLADPGSPIEANMGIGEPGRGPRSFAVNRHGELFFTERNGSNGASGAPKVSLNRVRFPDRGYAGANDVLLGPLDTPEGKCCLMVDQRQATWFAHDVDAGGGELGFKVFLFAERDAPLSIGGGAGGRTIKRAGYDRRLQSMAMAGNFAWYLVKDTPVGAGPDEWRLIKAIGRSKRSGVYLGDGRPDIVGAGGAVQEEDALDGSIFFDVGAKIAGAGGTITYATIDTQMERATGNADQANATGMIGHLGLSEI